MKSENLSVTYLQTQEGKLIPLNLVVKIDYNSVKRWVDRFKLTVRLEKINEEIENQKKFVTFIWKVGVPYIPDPYISVETSPTVYVQKKNQPQHTTTAEQELHLLLEKLLYGVSWNFEVKEESVFVSMKGNVDEGSSPYPEVKPSLIVAFSEFYEKFAQNLNVTITKLLEYISKEYIATNIRGGEQDEVTVFVKLGANTPLLASVFEAIPVTVGTLKVPVLWDKLVKKGIDFYINKPFLPILITITSELLLALWKAGTPHSVLSNIEKFLSIEIPENLRRKLNEFRKLLTLQQPKS